MKKLFILFMMLPFIIGLIIISCNGEEKNMQDLYIGKLNVYLEYVSIDGTNILQNDSEIEVFYDKNGIVEKVNRSNLTYSNGFIITSKRDVAPNGSEELCVKVFPSDYLNVDNISTTYVKLGDHQLDTIQCQFYKASDLFYLLKTWHNGTLVWDKQTNSTSPLIQIVK